MFVTSFGLVFRLLEFEISVIGHDLIDEAALLIYLLRCALLTFIACLQDSFCSHTKSEYTGLSLWNWQFPLCFIMTNSEINMWLNALIFCQMTFELKALLYKFSLLCYMFTDISCQRTSKGFKAFYYYCPLQTLDFLQERFGQMVYPMCRSWQISSVQDYTLQLWRKERESCKELLYIVILPCFNVCCHAFL